MSELLPLFVNLAGRRVLVVGAGPVAASKLAQLAAAGADVHVVAPEVHASIAQAAAEGRVTLAERPFVPADVDGAWLVVAAATPEVNRAVAGAAETRRVLVNAVDDPANASAFLGGVVRRDGVTMAISTSGDAPGLTALLRQALDALLPDDLADWVRAARHLRAEWRRDGVPMAARRPLLLDALNRRYAEAPASRAGTAAADTAVVAGGASERAASPERDDAVHDDAARLLSTLDLDDLPPLDGPDLDRKGPIGRVSLVGAGPGDPALLTRAAVARLRAADLVLYDALVDERVLHLARRAQHFFVGKRAGRHALAQSEIQTVMIRAARRGRRVVRLKGGDPFVFGRGGEEALALRSAGVLFDVVPGLTSAVAAPGLAGIPVTHRGLASAVLVLSGHDEAAFAATVGGVAPSGTTVVVLMGLARRAALASQLIDRGWAGETPAALVAEASWPGQEVWRGSLADLAAGKAAIESDGPALFVVGDVAALDVTAKLTVGGAPTGHDADGNDGDRAGGGQRRAAQMRT